MSYSLEIEGLVRYKHKLEADNKRLRAALTECASEWKSEPGSVIDCFNQSRTEFIRRMGIAQAALNGD